MHRFALIAVLFAHSALADEAPLEKKDVFVPAQTVAARWEVVGVEPRLLLTRRAAVGWTVDLAGRPARIVEVWNDSVVVIDDKGLRRRIAVVWDG